VRVAGVVPLGSPAYNAGLDRDDVILAVGSINIRSAADVTSAIRAGRPGDVLPVIFERRGVRVSANMTLVEDPRIELVPVESTGQPLTSREKQLRDGWLSSAADHLLSRGQTR
jgi:predicted metalloprotease with PDZ domain